MLFEQGLFSHFDQGVVGLIQCSVVQKRVNDLRVPPIPWMQRCMAATAQQFLYLFQLRMQDKTQAQHPVSGRYPLPRTDLVKIDFTDAGLLSYLDPGSLIPIEQILEFLCENGLPQEIRVMLEIAVEFLVFSEIPEQLCGALFYRG